MNRFCIFVIRSKYTINIVYTKLCIIEEKMGLADTYINYGVSSEIARMLENRKISKNNFKTTPNDQLVNIYGIEKHIVEFVKDCITGKHT